MSRWRSERCDKVHLLRCVAYVAGVLLRKVWALAKPRNAVERAATLCSAPLALIALCGHGMAG